MSQKQTLFAYGVAVFTMLIWAGVMIAMRYAAITDITPVEIGLLRLLPGAIFFAPIWLKFGLKPKNVSWLHAVMVALGSGVGFTLFMAIGTQFAPAADAGIFGPGALPLYIALISALLLGERFTTLRKAGFVLIFAGVLLLGGWKALFESENGAWVGHLWMTAAVLSWACYTIAFKLSGISAKDSVAIITLWGTIAFGLAALVSGDRFEGLTVEGAIWQLGVQGIFAGILAAYTYGYVIARLGPSRTAAFGALVPAMVALGGWLFLGETLTIGNIGGIIVVTAGMLLASGVLAQRESRARAA